MEEFNFEVKDFIITNDLRIVDGTSKFRTTKDGVYRFEGKIDFNLFSPSNRRTYTRVPDGLYTPSELGLKLPFDLCSTIAIGMCSAQIKKKTFWTLRGRKTRMVNTSWGIPDTGWSGTELAHAHDTRMCFKDGRYIFKAAGVMDETVLHEYAHILTGCEKHMHDKVWQAAARKLGHPNPTPTTYYSYYGDPLVEWGT